MTDEPPSETKNGNGVTSIARLLNQLNVPTLLAVMMFGGGNLIATKSSSDQHTAEVLKALREIHDLHSSLDDFERRQKDALDKQNQIIANQQQLISQLHLRNGQ